MVAVLLPAGWMHEVDTKLEQLLHANDGRIGPQAVPSAGPDYLTREEAATITGYCAKTIGRWIRSRRLKAYGLRGDRVKRAELDALMASLPKGEPSPDDVALAEVSARLHADDGDE